MNTANFIWEQLSLSEFQESIELFNQRTISTLSYPKELIPMRTQIVQWIIFISKNLSFRGETCYLAITLFDAYIMHIKAEAFANDFQLAAIACLSLASKQEEINCNYTCFLTENVLNNEQFPNKYTIRDLTKKEVDVLIQLSFKTQLSTPYNYTSAFLQICYYIIGANEVFEYLLQVSEQLLIQNVSNPQSLALSPFNIALSTINESLILVLKHSKAEKVLQMIKQLIRKGHSCSQSSNPSLDKRITERFINTKAIKAE